MARGCAAVALLLGALVPALAHADRVRCCDGTYSPTCTYVHSGCCSHHGGVCLAPSAPDPPPPEQHGTVTVAGVEILEDDGSVDRATLAQPIAATRTAVQGCYDGALLLGGAYAGDLTITIRLGPAGRAAAPAFDGPTAVRVSYCATRALTRVQWPATRDGTVDVVVSLALTLDAAATDPPHAGAARRSRPRHARPPRRPRG